MSHKPDSGLSEIIDADEVQYQHLSELTRPNKQQSPIIEAS